MVEQEQEVRSQELHLEGAPICPGIAIGFAYTLEVRDHEVPQTSLKSKDIVGECHRYRHAVQKSAEDLEQVKRQLVLDGARDGAAILDTHLQILKDPMLNGYIEDAIESELLNAEFLLSRVVRDVEGRFEAMSDPFFRERFRDFQDVSRRIMHYLRHSLKRSSNKIPRDAIVFADELVPSDTAEVGADFFGAFVTASGGSTSHAAIVAKAKGIPYVASVNFQELLDTRPMTVIVDGRMGKVICHPTEDTLSHYRRAKSELEERYRNLETASSLSSETYDGYKISLSANVEMVSDLDSLQRYGGSGVGLFRSEYIFLSQHELPTEDQQFQIYRDLVERIQGLPVIIRTFDLAGDKASPAAGDSPTVGGGRSVRFMLENREAFKTQIRAILRASAYGEVSILFPMVSGLLELREAKELVRLARAELEAEGQPTGKSVGIGCMIEVPSAAILCDVLAKECDFLSIGTNDLVQYSLAVDRGSLQRDGWYSPTHPGVIRMIKMVASEGARNRISVKVCGEMAADPLFTALLLGLGIRELSVAPRHIPIVKHAIRNTGIVEATELAQEVLRLNTASDIAQLLEAQLASHSGS